MDSHGVEMGWEECKVHYWDTERDWTVREQRWGGRDVAINSGTP